MISGSVSLAIRISWQIRQRPKDPYRIRPISRQSRPDCPSHSCITWLYFGNSAGGTKMTAWAEKRRDGRLKQSLLPVILSALFVLPNDLVSAAAAQNHAVIRNDAVGVHL